MGGGFVGGRARQHPDLTPAISTRTLAEDPSLGWVRAVVLTLLSVDGVICAVAAAFFLPVRIGSVPFPISALFAGLLNAALVWAALQWTSAPRVAALPLWCWLVTVAAMTLGGPGGDIVFGGSGAMGLALLVLIVVGALPPAVLLWRYLRATV